MQYFLDCRYISIPDNLSGLDGIIVQEHFETKLKQLIIKDGKIIENNKIVGEEILINSPEDMTNAMETQYEGWEYVLINTGDWHIIPLENLIAKFNSMDIQLLATAKSPENAKLLENILELGIDICVIQANEQNPLDSYYELLSGEEKKIELSAVEVSNIERIGVGDRVCIDTCSLLKDGDGILVGSTAAVTVLVQAEVAESGFVNARPFRVNAGVVASYTIIEDKTRYLSEIKAGSSVMIVNRQGNVRKELVARVKIERRPLILLHVLFNNKEYPIILQDAETVRLMTESDSTRIDKLMPGDKILARIDVAGRHFGMAVNETIEER